MCCFSSCVLHPSRIISNHWHYFLPQNVKLWQMVFYQPSLSLPLFCHLPLNLWVGVQVSLKLREINLNPRKKLGYKKWFKSISETHLQYWVFVATAHHRALQGLFELYKFVNHTHGCLLVIGVLALPEPQAAKDCAHTKN